MTKRLNALEARGLVSRESDPNDGRSSAVVLTSAGKGLVERVLPEHASNEGRLVSELSAKERRLLATLLERFAVSMDDLEDARLPRISDVHRGRRK
jgi:DNA-binding MarR family transcriptional regulator